MNKKPELKEILANLPSVDAVINTDELKNQFPQIDNSFLTYCIRKTLFHLRQQIKRHPNEFEQLHRDDFLKRTISDSRSQVESLLTPSLRWVVNGTGVILHTGLGRAPLAESVRRNIGNVIEHYSNVELDLETGKRGERQNHVEELLCYLSGAEEAAVVNNNAGAVFVTLNALAKGKEVIISRGQLIEIGGSFRLPDVMAQSGAIMREVGTTNKTHFEDYQNAINENTGAILVAHSSNYRILGFSQEVPLSELVPLTQKHHIPLIYDLGGGVFIDLKQFDLPYEPVVSENIKLGIDVVTFSGDKVLGGPQSGILVGKRDAIRSIRKNSLMRALRCDKLIFSALEETLKLYLDPQKRLTALPVFRMLLEPLSEQEKRATYILREVNGKLSKSIHLQIEEGSSQIGSGALPLAEIPSIVLRVESKENSAEVLANYFRKGKVPIVGYIRDDGFNLNMRTIREDESIMIIEKLISF